MTNGTRSQIDTLVIGGGQAGLAVGYHLARGEVPFLILDANDRTGDSWRHRWDSLKLFTPNRFNSLPGLQIPGEDWGFPTKDHVANYLEAYAGHFGLPIRHRTRVDALTRRGNGFVATAGADEFEADNVIVAMADFQRPKVPALASELDSEITQLHVADYKNPSQLRAGAVLVVGLGNSGAEIALELVRDRRVWLSGKPTAVQPFRPERLSGRILMPFVGPIIFNRLLTTSTPMGRKLRAKILHKAAPLLRVKPKDLAAAGVERVARTVGVVDGRPALEDGTVLDVANVVWCTGFDRGFSWIDLPIYDGSCELAHERGVPSSVPGLYFVGLKFLYSMLSDTLLSIGRDSRHVVDHLVSRREARDAVTTQASVE